MRIRENLQLFILLKLSFLLIFSQYFIFSGHVMI
jgi:hypothetical protein